MSSTSKSEIILKGIPASPGVAHGSAFIYLKGELEIPSYLVPADKREEEIERFEQSLLETRRQISAIRNEVEERLGEEEARIFDAHQMVLEDRALIEETITGVIDSGYNIEHCFQKVASRYIEAFANIDDEYIKERVSDIRDVARRLLQNLMGKSDNALGRLSHEKVIVAEDLSPSDTATLEKGRVLAIVTDQGSRTSHAVIMARSIAVPAVVGLHNASKQINPGDTILVDGYEGLLILNPKDDTLFRYGKIRIERQNIQRMFEESLKFPAKTQDGADLTVMLNIEGLEDPAVLRTSGAEGVGLFRTEALFLRKDRFPSEDEQFVVYKRIVEGISPQPVIIRTLDLGGDKMLQNNSLFDYEEANPFMGYRAIRFCLENPQLFKDQLRAILRASAYGTAKIMFPMISCIDELLDARQMVNECMDELQRRGQPYDIRIKIGSMIEIPGAAYSADHLAQNCDFFSIGTNDLIQYMLAVDRVNDRIAHLYQPSHPAVIRTIHHVIQSAHKYSIPVGICGEMAGDPVFAPLLYGLGADELSISQSALPEIKYLIRAMRLDDARKLAGDVLNCSRPHEITELVRKFYFDHIGPGVVKPV
ncbi:MAG: phosphoenolpyruvate--protein phosphotransferase [Verrucomicrobiota bacterium]|nr:phosphoenolpyruvate--protein phosphotransferase [Verrucomicrobiota bacterium]